MYGLRLLQLLLFVALSLLEAVYAKSEAGPPGPAYFGEGIVGLTITERESVNRGFRLFIRTWPEGSAFARNGSSCLGCHNTPMPGGSGIAPSTFVQIDNRFPGGSRREIIQRDAKASESHNYVLRRTPSLFGLGYLETERTIVRDDRPMAEGSGSLNVLPKIALGAYGRIASLEEFVSLAFADELGVATYAHCPRKAADQAYPVVCSPVLSRTMISDVSNFIRSLEAPPVKRLKTIALGRRIFSELNCGSCHLGQTKTGDSVIPALAGKLIWAYTDSRLHDMGTENIRTTPLWGLSSFGPPYLHDGSANSIENAILRHGGEARTSGAAYRGLSGVQREQLIEFLKSL